VPIDPKKLEEIKAANPGVSVFETSACDRDFLFRRPTRAEYKRYRSKIFDVESRDSATEQLTRACVLYPDPAAFDALLEELPALGETVGAEVLKSAGVANAEAAKKV
jgi:hypothetical protein